MQDTAILVLAAGNSSRLGQPKQLLSYLGKTLIQNIVDVALSTNADAVFVITGSFSDQVILNLEGRDINIVQNLDWAEGMSSGIRIGLKAAIEKLPNLENVILTVCDQPFVTSDFLCKLLLLKNKSKKTVVSSAYAHTIGTPVLFDKRHFDSLFGLKGKDGAKKLLEVLKDDMITISFPKGFIDIDTEADYIKLIND